MRVLALALASATAAALLMAGVALTLPGDKVPPLPTGTAKPQRIMSVNLCTDLLLLMLVPKERIASISALARDPVAQLMPGADDGVPVNRGTAEEVILQQPDLILASPWSNASLRHLAAGVGAPLVSVESANSFADIRRITRQVGNLVGEPERAEQLVAAMNDTLAELSATPPRHRLEVAVWNPGDAVPGAGTLTQEIIAAAGALNLASRVPQASRSSLGLEELLAARPDVILRAQPDFARPSLRDSVAEHPILRRAYAGRRITYPEALYACGLPQSAEAARDLRLALDQVPAERLSW